jgi:hypothetical protein
MIKIAVDTNKEAVDLANILISAADSVRLDELLPTVERTTLTDRLCRLINNITVEERGATNE